MKGVYKCGSANEYLKRRNKELREQAILILGGKCVRCGFSDIRALQIDHIYGGGSEEKRRIGQLAMYRKIIKGEDKAYQLLCANCNWIKKSVEGEKRKVRHSEITPLIFEENYVLSSSPNYGS